MSVTLTCLSFAFTIPSTYFCNRSTLVVKQYKMTTLVVKQYKMTNTLSNINYVTVRVTLPQLSIILG